MDISIGWLKKKLKDKGFNTENLNFGQLINLALKNGVLKDNSISLKAKNIEKRKNELYNIWYTKLKEEYGIDFAEWANKNVDKIRRCVLDTGCRTEMEYREKIAQRNGYQNYSEQLKEWKRKVPKEINEDCSMWFGEFIAENYLMKFFRDIIPAPPNNPFFDWECKKGKKIDSKASCFLCEPKKFPRWKFYFDYNPIADYFILSAWDNRDSLKILHVWLINRNEIVRRKPLWNRATLSITNSEAGLKEFQKFEITDKLDNLKNFCDGEN